MVGAPFFEELFFRGLVQGTLTARWGVAVGLVVQALLFAVVHLNPENGWGNVGTFVIITAVGLGLGLIRRYSGRLPPGDVHPHDLQRDHRHDRGRGARRSRQADGAGALGMNAGRRPS